MSINNLAKSVLIFTLLFGVEANLISQSIDIFGGVNINSYYGQPSENNPAHGNYKSGFGYEMGIGFNFKLKRFPFRTSILFQDIKDSVYETQGGLAGFNEKFAKTEKKLISMNFYFLNLNTKNGFELNLGCGYSRMIDEKFEGTINGIHAGGDSWNYDIKEDVPKLSTKENLGIAGRLAYNIKLNKTLFISPQYGIYFGLGKEFLTFSEYTRSIRHSFSLGFGTKF